MTQKYDLIGDIHGHHISLINLLEKLGYTTANGYFSHPERKVIFLGDFIDRGPGQKAVINIVRDMIDNGTALAVMGNHEFNALCFNTEDPDKPGAHLRPRIDKNIQQHQAFLDAYKDNLQEMQNDLSWFRTLPMWLDLGKLKVIHACWDEKSIEYIKSHYSVDGLISDTLLIEASNHTSETYQHLETILKGKENPLPDGHKGIPDKAGTIRHAIRVKWWKKNATTYKQAYLGPEVVMNEAKEPISVWTHIPDDEIAGDHLITYSKQAPPVFLGHYWLEGKPKRLAENIACLDYSVAHEGKTDSDETPSGHHPKLVAYRWDGESKIANDKFTWVARAE